jgi:hypothetical protein
MDRDKLILALNKKWHCQIPFGWIPITSDEIIPNTEIYDSNYLDYYIDQLKISIEEIYQSKILFELREDGQFQELNIAECDFSYDGLEYIYTDKELNFVLYFSHEGSTTIGGEELLTEIHKIWPEYNIHFWKPIWE